MMRFLIGAVAVLLVLAGCGGSSNPSTSGSGGSTGRSVAGATTSGPSTSSGVGPGTSTGAAASSTGASPSSTGGAASSTGGAGTTTGAGAGTTTGGAGLADGQPCGADGQCQSGVCGVGGSGNCCSAACATGDATCGATACDGSGACLYPIGSTPCGTDSCSDGELTRSACDGAGTCAARAPAPCANNLACQDATSCLLQCNGPSDCVAGFRCDTLLSHSCIPDQATGPCASDSECLSNVCGANGSCCSAACAPAVDPACNPVGCDVATGACLYPQDATCGASCSGNTLTAGTCDATGACGGSTSSTCPNNLNCDAAGVSCLASCSGTSDCVAGFYCSGGACVPQQITGPCASNDACTSGICGNNGSGNCCTAACLSADAACGYSGCDGNGGCVYPDANTACGGNCVGSTQFDPSTCDGAGTCLPSPGTDCSPYSCGPLICLSTCSDNTSCSTGNFCDKSGGACCSLANGASLAIDAATGDDTTACCGMGGNTPCRTLTHAMILVHAAQAQNVTLNATVNGGGGDWTHKESYPVLLDWGVELNAPGVYFVDQAGDPLSEIFDIDGNANGDTLNYASIVGSGTSSVNIGFDSTGANQTFATSSIEVESGATLYIANASVNGSTNPSSLYAILVEPGGTLSLAQDQSGNNTGTVYIGNDLGNDGQSGIRCAPGDKASGGCTVVDTDLGGASSVVIQGQESVSLDAEDFSSITLTANPVIGTPPASAGFGQCASSKVQSAVGYGLLLNGFANVTFDNGTIQCLGSSGIEVVDNSNGFGSPTLSMDSVLVQNTETGIYVSGGTATVSNSTFRFNYRGAQQDTPDGQHTGTLDLSGGGVGGNTVVCSSSSESNLGNTYPGVDVYNTSPAALDADGVAWDTAQPDYFQCDTGSPPMCACNLASCDTAAGSDDMNAVEDSFELGGISTKNNLLSGISCD